MINSPRLCPTISIDTAASMPTVWPGWLGKTVLFRYELSYDVTLASTWISNATFTIIWTHLLNAAAAATVAESRAANRIALRRSTNLTLTLTFTLALPVTLKQRCRPAQFGYYGNVESEYDDEWNDVVGGQFEVLERAEHEVSDCWGGKTSRLRITDTIFRLCNDISLRCNAKLHLIRLNTRIVLQIGRHTRLYEGNLLWLGDNQTAVLSEDGEGWCGMTGSGEERHNKRNNSIFYVYGSESTLIKRSLTRWWQHRYVHRYVARVQHVAGCLVIYTNNRW